MHPARIHILGIPIDALTASQALSCLREFLREDHAHHVMTPNSEMLVESVKNPAFRHVLQESVLNLPDSAGLLWAAHKTGQYLPERVTGIDTVTRLCAELDERDPVFLLGAAPGVAERAAEALRKMNPRLVIAGTYAGSPSDDEAEAIIGRINDSEARLLLVAFGAPKQDLWIDKHLSQFTSVRVAMGVGGTFDFLAGVQKRAPAFMRRLHLEWLWRLLQQPSRIGRIINATVVFPWKVVTYEIPPNRP